MKGGGAMKMMAKLTVILATLMLLSGAASAAGGCYDYQFSYNNLDSPEAGLGCVQLCFDFENHSGTYSEFCEGGNLVLFFDSLLKRALLYGSDTQTEVGHLKFHGEWLDNFNGELYCQDGEGGRYAVSGYKSDSCGVMYSDVTLKKDIEPLSSSLGKVMRLQGVSYDWKVDEYPDKGFTGDRQIGFIAQDVEKVFPELVRTDSKGYKSIYYAQMVAVLAEAIKEQQKEISELKKQQAMIGELTDKIAQLQKALEQKKNNMSASVK
jgi:hypothetical protein